MKKIIDYLNGKKTTIGALILFFVAIPHLENYIQVDIIDMITYIGMGLTTIGITHKGIKTVSK